MKSVLKKIKFFGKKIADPVLEVNNWFDNSNNFNILAIQISDVVFYIKYMKK